MFALRRWILRKQNPRAISDRPYGTFFNTPRERRGRRSLRFIIKGPELSLRALPFVLETLNYTIAAVMMAIL